MQTSLKLSLDTRRKRKDGTYPIIIRLGHFQKTTSIATGHSVRKEHWDDSKKCIRRSYDGVESISFLNNLIKKQITNAQEIINRLQDSNELDFLSVKQLKDSVVKKTRYGSFYEFADSLIQDLRLSQQFGTASSYQNTISRLRTLTNHNDLKFNELNYDFLKRFERSHLSKKGNTMNGLSTYMRTIRAIYNKGAQRGLIVKEANPFNEYKIKIATTAKRAIQPESVKKILGLKLEEDNWPFHYRNYFLLSYMFFGMSFIDMAFLKIENIVDGRIRFQRRKTSKHYDIKITDQLKTILDYYTVGKKKSDFILPIIRRDSLELQHLDVKGSLKRYNKGLRKLGEECGIEEYLTSYVSRHSFATHAMLKNVPLPAISAMLGHSKLTTTQIYLKSLPSDVLDAYQEELNAL